MTNSEINLLYAEVDRLLNDICKFLHEEIRNGFISPIGRNTASILIERSKKQLQSISMTVSLDTTESYVDMHAYKVNQHQECPELEVYSDVSLTYEPTSALSVIGEDQVICPYAGLPASEIKEGKTGHLYRKEKILFFEQQKKVFAAICHSWFLIYMNEHAPKPCQTFDLSRYGVRPSGHSKDTKKREESFDLINMSDSKLHQFTAYTPKDMQQWLSAIKQQIDMIVTKRSLPPIPMDKPQDDFIRLSAELNDDYEPLKNYMAKEKSELQNSTESLINTIKEDPLPLPPRNPNSKQYLPREPSDDSLSSNYDSVTPGFLNPSRESSNSFSEDDSDTHYDDPSEIGHRPSPYIINKSGRTEDQHDDEDEIYDYLEKTGFQENKTPNQLQNVDKQTSSTSPSKVQNKPTPTLKPKLILRFRQNKNSDV